jgi:hypothetical protein
VEAGGAEAGQDGAGGEGEGAGPHDLHGAQAVGAGAAEGELAVVEGEEGDTEDREGDAEGRA